MKNVCKAPCMHFLIQSLYRKPIVKQWGFPGGLDSEESACNTGDLGLISGWGSSCGARGGFLPRHDEDLREPLVRRQGSQVSMRVARRERVLALESREGTRASRRVEEGLSRETAFHLSLVNHSQEVGAQPAAVLSRSVVSHSLESHRL